MGKEQEKYQLVTKVELLTKEKLTFSVRNPLLFKDNERKYVKIIQAFALILGAALILGVGVMFLLMGSMDGLYMILPIPVILILIILHSSEKAQIVQLNMNFDSKLSYVEFENNYVGRRQSLSNPSQLKIVVRFFPLPKVGSIKLISVELVGLSNGVDSQEVSKEVVATFRFWSVKDAQDKLNEAETSFKFLADWLKVPVVVEENVLYCDTNTRNIF